MRYGLYMNEVDTLDQPDYNHNITITTWLDKSERHPFGIANVATSTSCMKPFIL